MILHVRKDYTSNIVLSDMVNDFISGCKRQLDIFCNVGPYI